MSRLYIRIAKPPEGLLKDYSEQVRNFYFGFAEMAREMLTDPEVISFVYHIVKREGIDENRINDIRVMVFPSLYNKNVLGFFHIERRQISIFPQLPFRVPKKSRKLKFSIEDLKNDRKLMAEIRTRSITVLIHEVLHLKYYSERLVRAKTSQYVKEFEKKENPKIKPSDLESLLQRARDILIKERI